jgi:cyclopropane fatty-acyl-phospholipid synthase-like methyltransferase
MKPFAESCEENKRPILEVLRIEFAEVRNVLEIGSGTGQHAVFFAGQLPHLIWHTSDVAEHHAGIQAWIAAAGLDNVHPPLTLDVRRDAWPRTRFEGAFSANTVHIMSWPAVEAMFAGIGGVLAPGGRFCLYGPFNYGGKFTSESNARFDQWLKARDPNSGVRNFEDLDRLANAAGMRLLNDYAMPANNRTLVWVKAEPA